MNAEMKGTRPGSMQQNFIRGNLFSFRTVLWEDFALPTGSIYESPEEKERFFQIAFLLFISRFILISPRRVANLQ